MSLFNVFKLSSQGMSAQRERLDAAAANLANSNTTRTPEGGPYRRRDTVFTAGPLDPAESAFESALTAAGGGFGRTWFEDTWPQRSLFDDVPEQASQGVKATTQLAGPTEVVRRYMPGHPDADANGFVSMPDVDPLEETVNMLSAARSFEANATAFNTAKELARVSLRLGENG